MPKCEFKGRLQRNFIEIALRHGCSPVNLLYIFRTPFQKNNSGWLLLITIYNEKIPLLLNDNIDITLLSLKSRST